MRICVLALICCSSMCQCLTTSGRIVRFADMPAEAPREGKRKKKRLVKRTKAITPLQAMMLRMAGTVVH